MSTAPKPPRPGPTASESPKQGLRSKLIEMPKRLIAVGLGILALTAGTIFFARIQRPPAEHILPVWLVFNEPVCKLRIASIGERDDTEDCPGSSSTSVNGKRRKNRDTAGYEEVIEEFRRKHPRVEITLKAHRHEWIKDHLMNFLKGELAGEEVPDVLVWSAGTHVSPYAEYLSDLSEIVVPLSELKSKFPDYVQRASFEHKDDYHFLPFKTYVWAFYYLQGVRDEYEKDWPSAENMDTGDLIKLAEAMKSRHLDPIAFGNLHGWPALGYFDVLNMRVQGVPCHKDLAERKVGWASSPAPCKGVTATLTEWQKLAPFYAEGWYRKSYRQAACQFAEKKAGLFFIGGFFAEELDESLIGQLRVFQFPRVRKDESPAGNVSGVDAPIDGFVFPRKAAERRPQSCSKVLTTLVRYLASPDAYVAYDRGNPGSSLSVLAAATASTYKYKFPVQNEAAQILRYNIKLGTVLGYLDRDFKSEGSKNPISDFLTPDLHAFLTVSAEQVTIPRILERLEADIPPEK